MTTIHRRPIDLSRPPAGPPARRSVVLQVALPAVWAGMTLVVALDGSWPWRLVRVVVVGLVMAAAQAAVRRGSHRAGALVAAGVGLVATPAGVALGIPFLAKEGWSFRAAGGLLLAAGGVALLVAGVVAAIRSFQGWTRVAAVPVALAVAYAVASPVAVSVYATNVPRPDLGPATPADHGLEYVDASFMTSDGARLSGWYVPSSNGAAVALLHGASSTRSNVLEEAVVLARHGYGVLLFDARGLGRSGGRAMNLGWYGDLDVAAAVSWLQERPDVDAGRIGAVGSSMGGEEVIGAMAADDRIRAVVAEGATGRTAADLAWLSDTYGLRGRIQEAVSTLTSGLTDLLTAAGRPRTLRSAAAAAAPRPVLLVAAGKMADEAHAADAIRRASPTNVEVWVVPDAAHTDGLRTQPAEWERRVTAFLDAALRTSR